MYLVLQCKQIETIQPFGEQHAGSYNYVGLSSEFYFDPTLGSFVWTNKDSILIRPTSVQYTKTCLRICWDGKRQMRKSILNQHRSHISIQQKCTSLSPSLSNIVEFSGAVLSCHFLFKCTNVLSLNAIKIKVCFIK